MKKSLQRFVNFTFIIIMTALLSSCYTQKIVLNADRKSGTMYLDYSFNDDDFEILSLILSAASMEDGEVIDPVILIDEEAFKDFINEAALPGVSIEKVSVVSKAVKNNHIYSGSIALKFKDFELLFEKIPAFENGFSISKEAHDIVMQQKIDLGSMGDVETLENYLEFIKVDKPQWYTQFMNAPFSMIVNLKTPFKETKGVVLSQDKKTASYNFKTSDVIGVGKKSLEFLLRF